MSSAFEKIVSRLPYSLDKMLASGISFFIKEQEPERVEFNVRVENGEPVGWEIRVRTDEQNVEEAKDFWIDNVQERL